MLPCRGHWPMASTAPAVPSPSHQSQQHRSRIQPWLLPPAPQPVHPPALLDGLSKKKKKNQLEIKPVWSHPLILEVKPGTGGTRALILLGCDLSPLQILCVLLQGSGEDTWNEFDVPGTGAGSLVPEGRGWAGPCTNTSLISYIRVPSLFQQWGNILRSWSCS